MKLLRLEFENVNSLAGRWEIDFTSPALRDGLFLIAGDTGAGKTSILDAITLALFGRTARAEVSQDQNEIMTRGANVCSASATFACAHGVYRAGWRQSRPAWRRKSAKIQKPFKQQERTLEKIAPDGSSAEIAGTPTGLLRETMRLIGLAGDDRACFEQFLRTAMLAQGKFDRFLATDGKDSDRQRSAILEQATGTGIYSRIGAAIHDRLSLVRKEVDAKEAELKGASPMDAAARQAKEDGLSALQPRIAALRAECDTLSAENAWHGARGALAAEIEGMDAEAARLAEAEAAHGPRAASAARARAARTLDAQMERASAARASSAEAAADAARREAALGAMRLATDAAEKKRRRLEDASAAAAKALEDAMPSIRRAADAESRLAVARMKLSGLRADSARACEDAAAAARRAESDRTEIAKQTALAEESKRRLETAPPELGAARSAVSAMEEAKAASETAAREAGDDWERRKEELEACVECAERALRYAREIASLSDRRARLRPGEACPLCGSLSHPLCEGAVPAPDREKEALDAAAARRDAVRARAVKAASENAAAGDRLLKAKADLKRVEDAWNAESGRIAAAIAKSAAICGEREKSLREAMERLPLLEENAGKARAALAAAEAECAKLADERAACGVDGDPESFRRRLQAAAEKASAEFQDAKHEAARAGERLAAAAEEAKAAAMRKDEAAAAAAAAAAGFDAACREKGFDGEDGWRAARMDDAEIGRTEREGRELAGRRAELSGRRASAEARLAEHLSKPRPRAPAAETAEALAARKAELEAEERKAFNIEGELKADDRRREEAQAVHADLDALRAGEAKWRALDAELGGADGANFKLFAQGVTLAALVDAANVYLAQMTAGRYVLEWDPDGPDASALLPSVADRFAGNERRPVSNLSGGERFQVSLALALGLSRLDSNTLEVETLFLDEGFGTLDERALDVAVATLESLQRDGSKTVGIISHVKELEARIPAKISAFKTGGGRSALSGAGVSRGRP